jgi:hypothetical protein
MVSAPEFPNYAINKYQVTLGTSAIGVRQRHYLTTLRLVSGSRSKKALAPSLVTVDRSTAGDIVTYMCLPQTFGYDTLALTNCDYWLKGRSVWQFD